MLAPENKPNASFSKFIDYWAPSWWAAVGVFLGGSIHSTDSSLVEKENAVPITTLKQPAPEVQLSISKDTAVDEIKNFIKTSPFLEIIKLVDDYNNPNKLSLRAVVKREDNSEMKMMLAPDNFELPKDIFDNITAHYRLPDNGHTIILYRQTSP
jgi:hypothetical protein